MNRQIILLLAGLLLVACSRDEREPIVVTRIRVVEGQEQVVTRVVRQTVEIAATPVVEPAELPNPVELDISFTGDYGALDPQSASEENAIDIIENVFAGLTRYDPTTNTIVPWLAQDWETSPDGRVWTFRLRDDILWVRADARGSGILGDSKTEITPLRPVTADDVVLAIQRACDPGVSTPDVFILFIIAGCERASSLQGVTSADLDRIGAQALDEVTLQVTLSEPAGYFLTLTSAWFLRPVPTDLVQEMGGEWDALETIITSGPYVIAPNTVAGTRTVLLRNPFWPLPQSGNVQMVNILHLEDETAAYALWKDLELDLSPVPVSEQTNALNLFGQKANLAPEQAVFYLAYDFESPVFRLAELRRAFGWAIDRERLIREVHGGRALAMRHFGPPGTIGAPPVTEVGAGYNPDRARQQFAASGVGDCRLLEPLTFMVSSSDLALQQAELLREMWMEELGCEEEQIEIQQVQFGTLLANTRPDSLDRPDIWELGWASYYPDEHNWLGDVLHCTLSENRQKRPCGQVDELIGQAAEEPLQPERWDLYRTVEHLMFGEDGVEPVTPLYARARYVLRQSWLSYQPAAFGGELFDTYLIDANLKDVERGQ